jgi:hypothetical protein
MHSSHLSGWPAGGDAPVEGQFRTGPGAMVRTAAWRRPGWHRRDRGRCAAAGIRGGPALRIAALGLIVAVASAGSAPQASAQTAAAPAAPTADLDSQPVEPLMRESPIPTKNLLQVIHDGGLMMLPIGVCSFLLLVFVFERAVSLRFSRVVPGPFVRRFLEQLREGQLDRDAALELPRKCSPRH